MAWSASKIFVAYIEDSLENTAALDLNSDSFKVALYNNSVTPSQTVTSANSAYNVDQWGTANEVYDGAEWAQAGQALDSVTFAPTSATLKFDAADEVSAGTSATLANVYGCLIYNDTASSPADQGVCYLYFGGVNSVTDGTFTVAFNASGIFTIAL